MLEGYNIAFKISGKTICGRTQDDLTIAARLVESLTKDDAGETQVSVAGHDVTFSASGLIAVTGTGQLTRDDMISQSLKKGNAAIIPATYLATGGTTYGGSVIMTNYSESSSASEIATWKADFRVSGSFTPTGSGSGA